MEQELKVFQLASNSFSHFSSNLFKTLISEKNDENIVSSSLSIHIILFILFYGTDGITKEELKSGIYLSDENQLKKEIKYLLMSLNNIKEDELHMTNVIYVDNNINLLQDFLSKTKSDFQTSIEKFNSEKSEDSTILINTWVKEKTKGKISHIISPNAIDEYTKIILINTLYFKSNWLHPFNCECTTKNKFYNIDNSETYVSTMSKKLKLPYGFIKNFNANFIKLDYLNKEFEMIIILPIERFGLHKIEENFDWNLVSKADHSIQEVEISLPKFKIEACIDLKKILKKMGINSIFDEEANFSLMTKESVNVDKILQKFFIEIDEKGSEAAAATTVFMRERRSLAETFIVEHPFVFIIHHKPSNLPLFIGSIRKLKEVLNKDEL